jgi:hypothetical protein
MDKIKNLLNGLTFGVKQEVGMMSVIPLLGENIANNVASVNELKFDGTSGYGTMVFTNETDKVGIVPTGYCVMTTQTAQDHGTPFSALIPPQSRRKNVEHACCIEQTQPGYIDGSSVKHFNFLPLEVRKKNFEKYIMRMSANSYDALSYNRLWTLISDFQRELVKKEQAHLIWFFNKFMDKLNQFNAEFEVVPNQRGAIIMLNNKVVGIEIAPTHEYWKSVWNQLIRDCYGSEIIRLTTLNLINEYKANQKLELNLNDCKSIEDIEKAILGHNQSQNETMLENVNVTLSNKYSEIKNYSVINQRNKYNDIEYMIFSAEDKKSYGELYSSNEGVLYCSMLFA